MTRKELYNICHDEAVAYANSEQWSKRTGEEKSFLIQGYLDAMMEARKSEITEKKKEYPKTYEECCEILQYNKYLTVYPPFDADIPNYDALHLFDLLETLRKLRICRDAYWKIAGEEMGLGKPWRLTDSGICYSISYWAGKILPDTTEKWCILTFPTKEMRDAFYENFKELIEQCKELL